MEIVTDTACKLMNFIISMKLCTQGLLATYFWSLFGPLPSSSSSSGDGAHALDVAIIASLTKAGMGVFGAFGTFKVGGKWEAKVQAPAIHLGRFSLNQFGWLYKMVQKKFDFLPSATNRCSAAPPLANSGATASAEAENAARNFDNAQNDVTAANQVLETRSSDLKTKENALEMAEFRQMAFGDEADMQEAAAQKRVFDLEIAENERKLNAINQREAEIDKYIAGQKEIKTKMEGKPNLKMGYEYIHKTNEAEHWKKEVAFEKAELARQTQFTQQKANAISDAQNLRRENEGNHARLEEEKNRAAERVNEATREKDNAVADRDGKKLVVAEKKAVNDEKQ